MKKCPKCGAATNKANATTCIWCGHQLGETKEESIELPSESANKTPENNNFPNEAGLKPQADKTSVDVRLFLFALAAIFIILPIIIYATEIWPYKEISHFMDRRESVSISEKFVRSAIDSDYATMRDTIDTDSEFNEIRRFIAVALGPLDANRKIYNLTIKEIKVDQQYAKYMAICTIRQRIAIFRMATPLVWDIELAKRNGQWYVIHADAPDSQASGSPLSGVINLQN